LPILAQDVPVLPESQSKPVLVGLPARCKR
jgi:hypothetical protein